MGKTFTVIDVERDSEGQLIFDRLNVFPTPPADWHSDTFHVQPDMVSKGDEIVVERKTDRPKSPWGERSKTGSTKRIPLQYSHITRKSDGKVISIT